MKAPNGVRVDSRYYTCTAGTAGPPTRSPRLSDGAWLILTAPGGVLLGQVPADGDPAEVFAALAETAAGLPGQFAFDAADLVPDGLAPDIPVAA